jgi:predicted RNase H-like HicB family nuclease
MACMEHLFDATAVVSYNGGMATYKLTVIIQKEGKWFVARSVELGVVSQGKTVEEAKRNLLEAVELYLEDKPSIKKILPKKLPLVTSIEFRCG